MAESDTLKVSGITDHPFEPQEHRPWLCAFEYGHRWGEYSRWLCRMAEAAHRETTVKR